jgi:hypothetical protein
MTHDESKAYLTRIESLKNVPANIRAALNMTAVFVEYIESEPDGEPMDRVYLEKQIALAEAEYGIKPPKRVRRG